MRLIDADAIQYTMLYKENFMTGTGKEEQGVWKSKIDKMPTVDAVPVRHGCWSEHKDYPGIAWLCSECGYFTTVGSYHYCPHCGARMDWGDGDPNGFNEETIQALKDTTERKNLSKAYETLDDMYADMETDCVPVIRCKDCKHLRIVNRQELAAMCSFHCYKFEPFADDYRECFCCWAERKEE